MGRIQKEEKGIGVGAKLEGGKAVVVNKLIINNIMK